MVALPQKRAVKAAICQWSGAKLMPAWTSPLRGATCLVLKPQKTVVIQGENTAHKKMLALPFLT
jgi:hypothetical protein